MNDDRTPDPDRDGVDREGLGFAADVWARSAPTLWEIPRAGEFEAFVRFDLEQLVDSMRYSFARGRTLEGAVDSVDVAAYLDGFETVMDHHLATRGLK